MSLLFQSKSCFKGGRRLDNMQVWKRLSMLATGFDQFGSKMKVSFEWSVTEEPGVFAKKDDTWWRSNVEFKTVKAGLGTMTASQEGKTATLSVNVLPVITLGIRQHAKLSTSVLWGIVAEPVAQWRGFRIDLQMRAEMNPNEQELVK